MSPCWAFASTIVRTLHIVPLEDDMILRHQGDGSREEHVYPQVLYRLPRELTALGLTPHTFEVQFRLASTLGTQKKRDKGDWKRTLHIVPRCPRWLFDTNVGWWTVLSPSCFACAAHANPQVRYRFPFWEQRGRTRHTYHKRMDAL